MASCAVCNNSIERTSENKIECLECLQIFHGKCLNLKKTDIDYIKENKQSWSCPTCLKKKKHVSSASYSLQKTTGNNSPVQVNVLNELVAMKNEFRHEFGALMARITNLEDNLANKLDSLTAENAALRIMNNQLQIKLNDVEQLSYNNSLDIVGLPVNIGDDLSTQVTNMFKTCLGISITTGDIDSIYKLKLKSTHTTKPNDIIKVKFVRNSVKDSIMHAKRGNKNLSTDHLGSLPAKNIFINQSLCPGKRKIFAAAWKLKRERKCHSVWCSNGKIFLTPAVDGDVHKIDSLSDLEMFI